MNNNTSISKDIFDQIISLCNMGINVARVGDEYFTYIDFTPSSSSNTSSIDFVTLKCICITEFILLPKISIFSQQVQFFQQFERWIQDRQPINMKFNKEIPYLLFSS